MNNKEKLKHVVNDLDDTLLDEIQGRLCNKSSILASKKIALKVLLKLEELGWTQKLLAEKMNVSPQQVSKIVKGSENLTLETLVKLESILQIELLASELT